MKNLLLRVVLQLLLLSIVNGVPVKVGDAKCTQCGNEMIATMMVNGSSGTSVFMIDQTQRFAVCVKCGAAHIVTVGVSQ